jgi:hypothetical protein
MTAIAQPLPPSSSNISPTSRNFILSAGFWLFSYAMLTFRGALLMDWAPVMDAQRILAVSFGAMLFWRVLRQIDELGDLRSSLSKVVGWVLTGTAAILVVRLSLDQMIEGELLPIARTFSFTLSWSAYFALWILGVLAFQPRAAAKPIVRATGQARPASVNLPRDEWADVLDLLIDEMGHAERVDRKALAARLLDRAGYEAAGDTHHNARVRAAQSLAARLTASR